MSRLARRLAAGVAVSVVLGATSATPGTAPIASAATDDAPFETVKAADVGSDMSAYGSVVADGTGTFHHVVRDDRPAQGIVYRQSTDGGRSFAVMARFAGESGGGTRPSIAVSGKHVAIVYIGASCVGTVCDELAYLVESTDGGSSWSAPRRLLDDGVSTVHVAVDGTRTWLLIEPYGRPIQLPKSRAG